jgi:hypothetical protein
MAKTQNIRMRVGIVSGYRTNPSGCCSSASPRGYISLAPSCSRRLCSFLAAQLNLRDRSGYQNPLINKTPCQFVLLRVRTVSKPKCGESHELQVAGRQSSPKQEFPERPRVGRQIALAGCGHYEEGNGVGWQVVLPPIV